MMNHFERWLPVPGYEGLYEVSDQGRVRSIPRPRTSGGLRKAERHAHGYAQVGLCRSGRRKMFTVHRLVLRAFVGEPQPGQECRHLDGDPSNNQLSNLAWGSRSENMLDAVRHGTHISAAKSACPRDHAYEDKRDSRGGRICLTCERVRMAAAYKRRTTPEDLWIAFTKETTP